MTVFQDLNEDILLAVLTKCDVYTVLCTSRINKLIHTLALSKHVWVAIVADLIARCLMDAFSDPDYIHYSGLELREAVKRVVCGPTWATSGSRPTIHHQLSVESPDIAPGNKPSTWTTSFKIVQVDLTTGLSFDVCQMPLCAEIGGWWLVRDAVISGDFVIMTLRIADSWAVLLINWMDSVYVMFHQTATVPGLAVVSGHVLVATTTFEAPHHPVLMVYTLASLATYWRPLTARWRPIATRTFDLHRIQQGSGMMPDFVEHPGAHAGWHVAGAATGMGMQLTLRESPLRQGSYQLTFVVSERGAFPPRVDPHGYRPDPGAIFVTYRVSVSAGKLRMVQTSAVPVVLECRARDVSYAGYSVISQGVEAVDLDRQKTIKKRQLRLINHESIHLSLSSGAVTTLSGSSVSVSYYS
ncbi:hypothetical protein B0H13DRAFT_2272647 [Mycena leptocephala]|nr:hypothetical protein B0H13DRAFT_2272647 [Mycena leptocephala]